jgi:hypothetical protein
MCIVMMNEKLLELRFATPLPVYSPRIRGLEKNAQGLFVDLFGQRA